MTAKVPLKVHLRLRFQNPGKPRTAGLCGRVAGACDCGPLSCAKIERPSPLEKPSCKVRLFVQKRSRKYRQKVTATMLFQTAFHRVFNFSHKWPTFAFTPESGYTLGFRRKIAHKRLHAETEAFRTGPLSLPSDCFTRCGNPAWPGGRTANFAAFGSWSETLLKNAESLRDSDALMRVAVPRRRGPAGLRSSSVHLQNRQDLLQSLLYYGTIILPVNG